MLNPSWHKPAWRCPENHAFEWMGHALPQPCFSMGQLENILEIRANRVE